MPVPSRLIRRLVLAPVLLVVEAVLVVVSPVVGLVGAVIAGRRALRAAAISAECTARHAAASVASFGLWVAAGFGRTVRSPRFERTHYALLRWFVGGLYRAIVRGADVEVRISPESAPAQAVLSARERPVVVLSLHAGEGDSLLVLHELLCRYGRRPRVVLHEALRLDPLIDALGERLPNRFVDPRGGDTEVEIAAMASDAGPADAVLIFPEGGNFSLERRARGISRLEQAGHAEEAAWAREMEHVSAPRPGGALAALEARPDADVVLFAHAGIPVGFGELWRRLGESQCIDLRLWHVPAADVPEGRDEQIDWLFGWWRELDRWVGERGG